jgi:hypothetical protein
MLWKLRSKPRCRVPSRSATEAYGRLPATCSDMVMLFQSKRVVIDAKVGTKYLQGQRIGGVP